MDNLLKLVRTYRFGKHFLLGMEYAEIAKENVLSYDNTRIRIERCLTAARSLMVKRC